jgi:hypothetical protein
MIKKYEETMASMAALQAKDKQPIAIGSGNRPWGGIYAADSELGTTIASLQAETYAAFGSSNALYPQVWPSLVVMQAELLQYSIRLLNGEGTGEF